MTTEYRFLQENAYFAASNSRQGFHSYYEHCFRHRVDRLYYIKGGPGTGKSTLLRRAAKLGESMGFRAEYYYCSSDPDSLDAVLLFGEHGSVGFLDATPPHPMEPMLPGVKEDMIDLGRFWSTEALEDCYDEILALNEQKSRAYRDAYRWLRAVGETSDVLRDGARKYLSEAKLTRTARRLLQHSMVKTDQKGRTDIALSASIGTKGLVRLDTYLRLSERICLIEDYLDTAYVLTEMLVSMASESRQHLSLSYHPVLPDRVDALFLPGSQTVFFVCDASQTEVLKQRFPHSRTLDMRRMIRTQAMRDSRGELRQAQKLREMLSERACHELRRVGDAHFKLEKIYSAAMDFDAKESYTELLLDQIFSHKI
jgi:hypothetical protein